MKHGGWTIPRQRQQVKAKHTITTQQSDAPPWPTEIELIQAERSLKVTFDDGVNFVLPAEYLRVESPSAEVQGHGGGKIIVAAKREVAITTVQPVGNYALRLIFSDGHDTGIYSWRTLYALGTEYSQKWSQYLAALETKGLHR